jgi:hypothetical protein
MNEKDLDDLLDEIGRLLASDEYLDDEDDGEPASFDPGRILAHLARRAGEESWEKAMESDTPEMPVWRAMLALNTEPITGMVDMPLYMQRMNPDEVSAFHAALICFAASVYWMHQRLGKSAPVIRPDLLAVCFLTLVSDPAKVKSLVDEMRADCGG